MLAVDCEAMVATSHFTDSPVASCEGADQVLTEMGFCWLLAPNNVVKTTKPGALLIRT